MTYKLNITFTWIFFNIFNLIIAVIRSCLKKTAQEIAVTKRDLLKEQEVFYVSTIYNSPWLNWDVSTTTIQEGKTTEPTAVKRWSSFFPYFATSWEQSFSTIYTEIDEGQ